jgi:hypothetical protein
MNSLNVSRQSFYYLVAPVNATHRNLMEKSGTYEACEQMIQMPFMLMQLSKLDEMLERLENNGRLTHVEHQGLLELERKMWCIKS